MDDDLRHTLRYAAEQVEPSPDAWDRIAERVAPGRHRRRPQRSLTIAAAAVVALIVGAAVLVTTGEDGPEKVRSGPAATGPAAEPFPGIWPEWTHAQYEVAVAAPEAWRDDAMEVTRRYLAERLELTGAGLSSVGTDAEPRISYRSGARVGAVVLARPGGPGAPLVVTQADAEGLLVEASALADPLVLRVSATVEGRGTASAAAFGAGSPPEVGFTALPGRPSEVRLDLGTPLPPTVLVTVRFAATDGVPHVAELRIDGPAGSEDPEGADPPDRLADHELVALTATGLVVATVDGTVVRQLADESVLGQGASGLMVAPDRSTVLFSRIRTGCLSEIVAVEVASGEATVVAHGRWPALSPDGEHLAYASDPDCTGHDRLVVRALATGRERVWAADARADDLPAKLRALAWSPDGNRIAFEILYEDGVELRLLAPSTGTTVLDSERLRAPAGRMWTGPTFDPAGSLVVIEGPAPGSDDPLYTTAVIDEETDEVVSESKPYGIRVVDLAAVKGSPVLSLDKEGRLHRFDPDVFVRLTLHPGWMEIAW